MNETYEANRIQHALSVKPLTDEEIAFVSGGHPLLVAIAGVTAIFAALNAAEGFGEKLGKALYYATN